MIKVGMLADLPYRREDYYRGGVLQANYRLVKALARVEELRLTVLSPCHHITRTETHRDKNASIIFWPRPRHDALQLFRGLRRALSTLLSDSQPDLVHASHTPSYIFAALHGRLPSIVTVHGVFRNELPLVKNRSSITERLRTLALCRLEDHNFSQIRNLIAITSEIERLVKACSPSVRVFRIDNTIDDEFFTLPDEQLHPIILFVGWISYRKGIHLLLQAFEALSLDIPGIQLRIVGLEEADPNYGISLRKSYADLVAARSVSFLGGISQEELYREVSRCSLLCLPSLAESAPMVIAQAMAAGKPVVASQVGGIPEMVEHNITGLLFEPGNVSELRDCLTQMLSDKMGRICMGRKAKEVASARYAPDAVARKTVDAYYEVLHATME